MRRPLGREVVWQRRLWAAAYGLLCPQLPGMETAWRLERKQRDARVGMVGMVDVNKSRERIV